MEVKIVISAILLVVVLIIALNLRKKIPRNEDNQGMFKPFKIDFNPEGDAGELEENAGDFEELEDDAEDVEETEGGEGEEE